MIMKIVVIFFMDVYNGLAEYQISPYLLKLVMHLFVERTNTVFTVKRDKSVHRDTITFRNKL